MELLDKCPALQILTMNLRGEFKQSIRSSRGLLDAEGVKKQRRIRGLKELNLKPTGEETQVTMLIQDETFRSGQSGGKELRAVLREELCREKESEVDRSEQQAEKRPMDSLVEGIRASDLLTCQAVDKKPREECN
jgi:hypothetical protein